VLAIAMLSTRLGHVGDGAEPVSVTDRRTFDLVASGFGPAAKRPSTLVVRLPGGRSGAGGLGRSPGTSLEAFPDIARVRSRRRTAGRSSSA